MGFQRRFRCSQPRHDRTRLTIGWTGEHAGWVIDAGYVHYHYVDADASIDSGELVTSATRGDWTLTGAWSPDALASGASGSYVAATWVHPVTPALSLRATLGHARLGGTLRSYSHAELGAQYTRGPWGIRLSGHATSATARASFGEDYAGRRAEVAVTYGF